MDAVDVAKAHCEAVCTRSRKQRDRYWTNLKKLKQWPKLAGQFCSNTDFIFIKVILFLFVVYVNTEVKCSNEGLGQVAVKMMVENRYFPHLNIKISMATKIKILTI